MNHLIDLDRYPLNQEGSPAWHHRSTPYRPQYEVKYYSCTNARTK